MSSINKIQIGQDTYTVRAGNIYYAEIDQTISFNTTYNKNTTLAIAVKDALQLAYNSGADAIVLRFKGDNDAKDRSPMFINNSGSLQNIVNTTQSSIHMAPLSSGWCRYHGADPYAHLLDLFDGRVQITYSFTDGIFSNVSLSTSCSHPNRNIGYWNSWTTVLQTNNTAAYTPSSNYNPSTKLYTDKTHYENMVGYDSTKTQVLKNVNGTLTWVDES